MRIRRALLSLASTASALGVPASAGAAPPLSAAADGLTDAQQTGIALLLLLAIAVVLGLRVAGLRRAEQAKRNPAGPVPPRPGNAHALRTASVSSTPAPPEPAPALSPEEVLARRAAIRMALTNVFRSPPSGS